MRTRLKAYGRNSMYNRLSYKEHKNIEPIQTVRRCCIIHKLPSNTKNDQGKIKKAETEK